MDARFEQAGRDFFLLSLLVSPVAYFIGTSVGGVIAQLLWSGDAAEQPADGATWLMIGLGLLAISYANRLLFRRLGARLVEQAVQLVAGNDGPAGRNSVS